MALTGFLANGVCHATSASALTALQATFPTTTNNILVWPTAATFTAPNTFTLTLQSLAMNATTATAATAKAIKLPLCDPAISIYGGTVFDPVVGAAYWSWAMTLILGLYLVARNAATIINAVRRF